MTGPEDFLSGADGPRPLPPEFRARLEEALTAGDEPLLEGIDGPRPLPTAVRTRIEQALLAAPHRRRVRRELLPLGAIAAVILLLIGVVAVLSPGGGGGSGSPAARSPRGVGDARLVAFDSCDELLDYLKSNALERVTAWGLNARFGGEFMRDQAVPFNAEAQATSGTAASAPPTPGASSTNVQEIGVDEPDTVKNDGTHLYVVANGALRVVDTASQTVLATVPLAAGGGQLLLEGNRLLVLGSAWPARPLPMPAEPGVSGIASVPFQSQQVVITTYDISDPANPTIAGTITLHGWLVAARLSNGLARVVVGSAPLSLPFVYPVNPDPASEAQALAQNKAIIESSTIEQWIGNRNCADISHPVNFSGFNLVSVHTIDPATPSESRATSLVAGGETVYASTSSLYVATQNWDQWQPDSPPPAVTTQIHQFDISDGPARYVASGEVTGYLLSQWAMSEYQGDLRVASTNQPPWGGGPAPSSESAVTVLRPADGALAVIGSVGGLGENQQIQGVRFIDNVGYIVTFRRTDPLYTVDLTDPTNPTVRGALELTGYSAYLHPIGDGLLLGVGQEATEEGRATGLQVSVFDVNDLDNPTLVSRAAFEGAYSEAEQDHHAFLWWPARSLAVVPTYGTATGSSSALLVEATRSGVAEVGEVTHGGHTSPENPWAGQISRSVVIGDTLYTISDIGVLATDLATLADAGWVGF